MQSPLLGFQRLLALSEPLMGLGIMECVVGLTILDSFSAGLTLKSQWWEETRLQMCLSRWRQHSWNDKAKNLPHNEQNNYVTASPRHTKVSQVATSQRPGCGTTVLFSLRKPVRWLAWVCWWPRVRAVPQSTVSSGCDIYCWVRIIQ